MIDEEYGGNAGKHETLSIAISIRESYEYMLTLRKITKKAVEKLDSINGIDYQRRQIQIVGKNLFTD